MRTWLTLSIMCLTCACGTPRPKPSVRSLHLEFPLPQRVIKVEKAAGGGHWISLERTARYLAIERNGSPDPGSLLAFAKKAVESRKPVYATVQTREKVIGMAPRPIKVRRGRRARVVGRPATKAVTLLVRLAHTPDPRAPRE